MILAWVALACIYHSCCAQHAQHNNGQRVPAACSGCLTWCGTCTAMNSPALHCAWYTACCSRHALLVTNSASYWGFPAVCPARSATAALAAPAGLLQFCLPHGRAHALCSLCGHCTSDSRGSEAPGIYRAAHQPPLGGAAGGGWSVPVVVPSDNARSAALLE